MAITYLGEEQKKKIDYLAPKKRINYLGEEERRDVSGFSEVPTGTPRLERPEISPKTSTGSFVTDKIKGLLEQGTPLRASIDTKADFYGKPFIEAIKTQRLLYGALDTPAGEPGAIEGKLKRGVVHALALGAPILGPWEALNSATAEALLGAQHSFRGEFNYSIPQAMADAWYEGKPRKGTAEEIVMNMGIPLDNDKWILDHPVLAFGAAHLVAWYESFGTDPIFLASAAKGFTQLQKVKMVIATREGLKSAGVPITREMLVQAGVSNVDDTMRVILNPERVVIGKTALTDIAKIRSYSKLTLKVPDVAYKPTGLLKTPSTKAIAPSRLKLSLEAGRLNRQEAVAQLRLLKSKVFKTNKPYVLTSSGRRIAAKGPFKIVPAETPAHLKGQEFVKIVDAQGRTVRSTIDSGSILKAPSAIIEKASVEHLLNNKEMVVRLYEGMLNVKIPPARAQKLIAAQFGTEVGNIVAPLVKASLAEAGQVAKQPLAPAPTPEVISPTTEAIPTPLEAVEPSPEAPVSPEAIPEPSEAVKAPAKAEIAQVTKESVKEVLDTRLQAEVKALEAKEGKRISLLDKSKLELKNINATLREVREIPEVAETGEVLFEGKQEIIKDLIAQRNFQQEKITELQPEKIARATTAILKDKIKNVQRGIRQGKTIAKVEVKSVQDDAMKLFKEADIDIPVSIKSIQTQEQLEKALPDIKERIARIEDKRARRALVKDIKSETKKTQLKKLRPEFRDKIIPLVDSIDLVKRKSSTIKNLESLADFIEREPENQVPAKRLSQLKTLSRKPIDEITTEELQLISDSINHFIKLNELKDKLIIKGKLREFKEVTNKAIGNVRKKHEQLNESLAGLDSFQQERETNLWNKIFGVDSFNAELKTEVLDGADKDIIQRVVYNEIDEGVSKGFKYKHSTEDFFKEKLKGIDTDKWSHSFQIKSKNVDKVSVKISGDRTITMTKGEAIAFNLHSRNERSRRHLLSGGFAFTTTPSKIVKLTEANLDTIAESLDKDMLTVADAMYEHYNIRQKVAINKVSVDLLGYEVAVEPDYFPIRTDFLDRFKDQLIKSGSFSQKTLEGLGMFKERQNAANALILEDAFVATYKSIDSASAYIGLAKALRGAKALLNDNDFQIAVRNAGLNHYLQSLKNYLNRVEGESLRLDHVDKLTQNLINKLDVAILGPNPFVWFKQPISYMAAATEMDVKYLTKGRLKNAVHREELAEMKKFHPQIRDRLDGNVTREAGEVAQVGRVKRFFTGKEVLSAKFMTGLRKGDLRAITGIWRATKAEIAEKQPNLKGDAFLERVGERAWEVIRRTQPTFHIKDRSTIGMSRNVFIRLLTKYSSQRNKNWMIIRRAFERYNRSPKTNKDKARLAKALLIIVIISPLFLMAIDELRNKIYGRKASKRSLFRQMTTKYITLNFGNIYFLGTAMNSLLSKIDRGTYAGYDINDPLTSTMDDLIDTVANAIRGIEQAITGEEYTSGKKKGDKKWKDSLKKFFIGAIDTSGKITGWGIHNVRKIITGLFKLVYPKLKEEKPTGFVPPSKRKGAKKGNGTTTKRRITYLE